MDWKVYCSDATSWRGSYLNRIAFISPRSHRHLLLVRHLSKQIFSLLVSRSDMPRRRQLCHCSTREAPRGGSVRGSWRRGWKMFCWPDLCEARLGMNMGRAFFGNSLFAGLEVAQTDLVHRTSRRRRSASKKGCLRRTMLSSFLLTLWLVTLGLCWVRLWHFRDLCSGGALWCVLWLSHCAVELRFENSPHPRSSPDCWMLHFFVRLRTTGAAFACAWLCRLYAWVQLCAS